MEPSRRCTRMPPMKHKQIHDDSDDSDNSSPVTKNRGGKIVQHSQSMPLQTPSTAKKSPSSRKPQSATALMSPAFPWPTVRQQTYHEKGSVTSSYLHSNVSGMRVRTGHVEAQQPRSSHQIPRPTKMKGEHAIVTRTASVKRHENEVETTFKDVERLLSRRKMIMKEGRWRPVLSSQHKEPKMPNLPEDHGRETKKGMGKNGNRDRKIVCITSSSPLPRRLPAKTSPFRASQSPRKPKSAPVQILPAFQWPALQEPSGLDQPPSKFNTRLTRRAIVKHQYHDPPQTRPRMRLLTTESDDCGTIPDDGNDYDEDVFDLSPFAGSQTPQAVSYPQMSMVAQHRDTTADFAEGELNVPKYVHDMMRSSSPDSFVSQLITNSKRLTLYDSIESPTLQERKKKARASRKKIDQAG